jgi:uncharacterized protein YggE
MDVWRFGKLALALPLALSALLLTTAGPARAEQDSGISVVGEGRVIATPDIARVTFAVERTDPALNKALADAAGAMAAVQDGLIQLGVRSEDIRTVSFAVSPIYDNPRPTDTTSGSVPALRGYRVSNAVEVTIRTFDSTGSVIDAIVGAGANRVNGISFETSRLADFKAQARELAVADARAKADQLARLAGVNLGQPRLIDESDASGGPTVRVTAMAAPAAENTPIAGGQLEVRTTVRVVWDIG